jgi:hypothetical protein
LRQAAETSAMTMDDGVISRSILMPHDSSLFYCDTEARDCAGQDDACITLAGITDTEDEPMPASAEVDT